MVYENTVNITHLLRDNHPAITRKPLTFPLQAIAISNPSVTSGIIDMAYPANVLFSLQAVDPHPSKPKWANLAAKQRMDPVPEDLMGPGLYALFFDQKLFYVGLHVTNDASFRAPVLDRWILHVVGQTLRAKAISFSPGPMEAMLKNLSGSPIDDLAAQLPFGRSTTRDQFGDHDLIKGSHCTYNKARFAVSNWDLIGPGNEETLLNHITCVFRQVPRAAETLLAGAEGKDRGQWVREFWLRPLEKGLIHRFKPICNAETAPQTERSDVGMPEVEAALDAAMQTPFMTFHAERLAAHRARRKPASRAIVVALDANNGAQPSEAETEMAEAEGMSSGELRFRRLLSPAGVAAIDALQDQCSLPFQLYYTDNDDLRIAQADGRERVLLVIRNSRGRFRVTTLAEPEQVLRLGIEASATSSGPLRTFFYIDPTDDFSDLMLKIAHLANNLLL